MYAYNTLIIHTRRLLQPLVHCVAHRTLDTLSHSAHRLLNCLRESSVPDYIARPGNYQQRQVGHVPSSATYWVTCWYPIGCLGTL